MKANSLSFHGLQICCAFFALLISSTLLRLDSNYSLLFKSIGYFFLVVCILYRPRFSKKAWLLPPLMVIFSISFYKGFNQQAAIEEMARFMFPLLIALALYNARHDMGTIAKFFVLLTITNDAFQCIYYISYFLGTPLLYEPFFDMGYIIRAEGWAGSFALFGFMNFVSFILIRHGGIYPERRNYLQFIFLAFSLLSTTTKILFAVAFYLLVTQRSSKGFRLTLAIAAGLLMAGSLYPSLFMDFFLSIDGKINAYLLSGESARSESYRVMIESIRSLHLFGEGLGSFGGPASVEYNSPLYRDYAFNWYGLSLATTDTFYPHLFVEIGFFGALLYLYFIFFYGQRDIGKIWFVIAVAFLVDNFSSFSMLAPPNVFSALIGLFFISHKNCVAQQAKPAFRSKATL